MSMTLTQSVQLGELRVAVRELTVGEIRAWIKRMAEVGNPDLVSDTLLPDISLMDLQAMTDLEPEQMEALTPSQLRTVLEACREVNKDFFGLRENVQALGHRLLEQLSKGSSATPAA